MFAAATEMIYLPEGTYRMITWHSYKLMITWPKMSQLLRKLHHLKSVSCFWTFILQHKALQCTFIYWPLTPDRSC